MKTRDISVNSTNWQANPHEVVKSRCSEQIKIEISVALEPLSKAAKNDVEDGVVIIVELGHSTTTNLN